jgi:hypothetical protein
LLWPQPLLLETIRREISNDERALTRGSRGPGRKLIADLGHEECGLTFEALAEVLGTTAWKNKLGSGPETNQTPRGAVKRLVLRP